ncbi:acyl-CoA N-acyltransferase, partial [Aureobasidium melanogenum]
MADSTTLPRGLRKATLEDATAIADLGSYVYSLTFGHSVPPEDLSAYLDEAYSHEATATEISNPNKDLIVATDNQNQIIGFALLTRGTTDPCLEGLHKTIELQRLYVHPRAHGGGVGKLLANCLKDMARKQGFEHLWLGVWEENVKAIKIYEKLGFTRLGSHDFRTGQVVQTDFIMVKRL